METPQVSLEEQAEAFKAWRNGETIQFKRKGHVGWGEIEASSLKFIPWDCDIRRKPQPKLRPWTKSEFPLNAWFRRKGCQNSWFRCLAIHMQFEEFTALIDGSWWKMPALLTHFEWSVDGKEWDLECGTYEP